MSLFDLFYNKSIINLYVIFNNRNNKIIIFIDLYIIFILISKFIYKTFCQIKIKQFFNK